MNDTTAILTADNLLYKIQLTSRNITATLMKEFDDELDPILFINKVDYNG